jgi:hypothetical protein
MRGVSHRLQARESRTWKHLEPALEQILLSCLTERWSEASEARPSTESSSQRNYLPTLALS